MHRKTDLTLLAVKPGWNRGAGREWTATFRLAWGEERHMLAVAVVAANGTEAEAVARRAAAAHLRSLAEQVVRPVEPETRRLMTARAAAAAEAGTGAGPAVPGPGGKLRIA